MVAGAMILIEQDASPHALPSTTAAHFFLPPTQVEAPGAQSTRQDSLITPPTNAGTHSHPTLFVPAIRKNLSVTSPEQPAPGIYEAKPWTMIVVVPGPHPDDRCLFGGGGIGSRMPMKTPDLRLQPRKMK